MLHLVEKEDKWVSACENLTKQLVAATLKALGGPCPVTRGQMEDAEIDLQSSALGKLLTLRLEEKDFQASLPRSLRASWPDVASLVATIGSLLAAGNIARGSHSRSQVTQAPRSWQRGTECSFEWSLFSVFHTFILEQLKDKSSTETSASMSATDMSRIFVPNCK